MLVSRAQNATERTAPALQSDAAEWKRRKRKSAAAGRFFLDLPLTSLVDLRPHQKKKKNFKKTSKKQAVKLKTKKRPKKLTPSDKKHVGATYPALPPPPPAFTILKAGASN